MADNKNKKSSFIGLRVPEWLKKRLEANAEKDRRSLSSYIYSLLANNVSDHNETDN